MSPIPVSKTKIIPPRRRPELLTRKRLLDMLFEALDKKLTLVSAPAGYGKTSLLIDMADQSELPCCWLALDELDRDPHRFAAYFIAALAECFPKFGSQSKSVLDGIESFEEDMERLLVGLVNELYEQVHEHFIFVLDDFHLLDGVQNIQNFINRFVQLVDENCHLVISSRTLASLNDLPLLVAREQVSGLSFTDLAFQPHELQALLAQNQQMHISDEEAIRLIEETEGWITGLQFSDAGILKKNLLHGGLENAAGLFEYLGQQVLDRQAPELREFVLRTSLLDEFDAALCEEVFAPLYSESQDWHGWIRTIARNNLFALPVGEDGKWLRYHHLFRDFIRDHFNRERPHEVVPILSRLQTAYEDMGEWEKAHHICRQLDDANLLADMVERASTSMLQRAHLTMESWINELPPSMTRSRPGLLSIRGTIAYTKGDLQEGLDLLCQAEEMHRREHDIPGLILTLIRRGSAYRFLGDYAASLRDAEEVITLTETSDERQMLYADALRLKGLALYRLGKANQAVTFLERSLETCRVYDEDNVPILLMETGMAYRAIGNFTEAHNAYQQALAIWQREGNLFWQASLLNNLGVLYQFQGEYEKAALAFEGGVLSARRSRYTRLDILISIGLGDLYIELADFEMARQNYQHAVDTLQNMDDRLLARFLSLSQANFAFFQNDAGSVYNFIKDVENSIVSGGSDYEQGYLNLTQGRLYLLEEKFDMAAERFENAEAHFIRDGRNVEVIMAKIWRAAAYFRDGNEDNSIQILDTLTADGGKFNHVAIVTIYQAYEWLKELRGMSKIGRTIRNLFIQADRLANEIPAIRRQLRRQARVVSAPAPKLLIKAFGKAEVRMDGRLLTNSDWQTQSVRELFFYLLSVSKPLTKEQIGETLWSEQYEPAKLKLRFKNEIYRLRRAVGQDVVIFTDVFYAFNRDLDYEYDVEAFESFLTRAKSTKNAEEQIEFYRKAIDLVRGPYLNDMYMDWAVFDRERLGQAYLNALANLADLYQKNTQLENAIDICKRAIDYDPGYEVAYRISMQTYSRLGDRASIQRVYQSCRDSMKTLFNLPPSRETEALYQQLTG